MGGKFCRTTLSSRVLLPQTSVGRGWAGLRMVLSNAWVSEALLFLKFSGQEPQIFLVFHLRGRVRAWKLVILGRGILRSALTGSTPRTVRWHRIREPEAQVGFLCVCLWVEGVRHPSHEVNGVCGFPPLIGREVNKLPTRGLP